MPIECGMAITLVYASAKIAAYSARYSLLPVAVQDFHYATHGSMHVSLHHRMLTSSGWSLLALHILQGLHSCMVQLI